MHNMAERWSALPVLARIGIVVVPLVVVGIATSTMTSPSKTWSALPHAMGCTPVSFPDRIPVPDVARVRGVSLSHIGGQRLQVSVEFELLVPDGLGSIEYAVILGPHPKSHDNPWVSVTSPSDGLGWRSDGLGIENPERLLVSVEKVGKVLNLTLDLASQDHLLGRGPFKPDVSVIAWSVRPMNMQHARDPLVFFDDQECPW
jgi:hypothetical protein